MTTEDKLLKLIKLADAMYYAAQYLTTDASRLHEAMDEYHQFIINEYYKEEPVSEDNNLRKASEEYLKVLSETPYNNTPITNAQTIVRELITFLDIPSKYNPNHIEEPVSEDLGDYINELSKQFPEVSFAKLSRIAVRVAKWQKEQFEKNRIKHCNSITNEQAELEQGFIDQHLDKHQRMPTFLDAIEYGMRLQKEQMMAKSTETTFNVSLPSGLYDKLWAKDCKEGDKLLVIKKDEL